MLRLRAPGYRTGAVALDLVLFTYVFWFRIHGVSESFWLHADQIRDWQVALRPLTDLPLVGPTSLAGGNTAGPVYYWFLWLAARVVGPWVDYLPHAGAIGISLFQSGADVLLLHGLYRKLASRLLALVIVLAVATSGHDATISSTIWNPPVAIAFEKIALALVLLTGAARLSRAVAISATAWLAVQAHTTPLPVALPVILYAALADAREKRARDIAKRVAVIAFVIAVLQIPWLIHRLTVSAPAEQTPMSQSISAVVVDPFGALRPVDSASAMFRAIRVNSGLPLPAAIVVLLIVAGGVGLLRLKDPALIAIGPIPLLGAIAIYSVWQGTLNENYWFLPLAPPAALCATGWIAAIGQTRRTVVSGVLLALLLAGQPRQAAIAWSSLRTPVYGALVRGARSTLISGITVREVRTTFPMPPGTDPAYLYALLGGTLDSSATERVVVSASGAIRFESVR